MNAACARLRGVSPARLLHKAGLLCMIGLLTGCAGVRIKPVSTQEFIAQHRGDILSSGTLSIAARNTLSVIGQDPAPCRRDPAPCIEALSSPTGLDEEQRLSALAELWLAQALNEGRADGSTGPGSYLQAARYAYAYLFYTTRPPAQRAFEERQTQVRDYYNYATEQVSLRAYRHYQAHPDESPLGGAALQTAGWRLRIRNADVRLPEGERLPDELIPASTLTFRGLRSIYRRDGLGAELVAVTRANREDKGTFPHPWSEPAFPAVTAVLSFPGSDLEAVLRTREAMLRVYDPYKHDAIRLAGDTVPLAANFTSGYGLWLARSGFATQAIRNVLGGEDGLREPHIYLLQPYDPKRRIVLMLHGLASSPEAWVNVANEVLGDEDLRRNYQIWQVYYPTGRPLAYNNRAIRQAFQATLDHFDPDRTAPAGRDITLIGHSMGGVLGRLLVSSSGNVLHDAMQTRYNLEPEQQARILHDYADLLYFTPVPGVSRAVFIAAPHRGTAYANNRLARFASSLIRLPLTIFEDLSGLANMTQRGQAQYDRALISNGIDNLSDRDSYLRLSNDMAISSAVRYHSIIARRSADGPLEDSDDGLVSWRSAHLEGAVSEKIIPGAHSIQETPPAILEIRRILHEHLQALEPDRRR
ncbi:MAG: alpha/beta hydrolase [Castellaniella sp.]|uniref:esterase/lipase family protein n=1 Tax=Castellaniella sp. TaxID=1955812 RepID=UPI003C790767